MVKGEWASAWHCAIAFEDFNLSMTKNASAKIVNGYSPTEATGNIPGCRLRSSVNRFDEDSEGRCQKKRAHRTDYRIAELGSWVRGSRQLDSRLVRDSTSAGRREKTAGES